MLFLEMKKALFCLTLPFFSTISSFIALPYICAEEWHGEEGRQRVLDSSAAEKQHQHDISGLENMLATNFGIFLLLLFGTNVKEHGMVKKKNISSGKASQRRRSGGRQACVILYLYIWHHQQG